MGILSQTHLDFGPVLERALAAIARKWHIQTLSLFGSALTPAFHAQSDIDFLIEFQAGKEPSYFELTALKEQLEALVQRKVDLVTPAGLNNSLNVERAQQILNSAQVILKNG